MRHKQNALLAGVAAFTLFAATGAFAQQGQLDQKGGAQMNAPGGVQTERSNQGAKGQGNRERRHLGPKRAERKALRSGCCRRERNRDGRHESRFCRYNQNERPRKREGGPIAALLLYRSHFGARR